MIGWSIRIKHGGEEGKQLLYAETTDAGLDRTVSARALEVIDADSHEGAGFGYPNRYLIYNSNLPKVALYRFERVSKGSAMHERRTFELAPFPDLPEGEVLWVELWDQS